MQRIARECEGSARREAERIAGARQKAEKAGTTSTTAPAAVPAKASVPAETSSAQATPKGGAGRSGDASANGEVYGYARVSAKDQNLSRQLDALREFPVSEQNIYRDKASGRDFKRPGYRRLVRRVKPGDVLVIKSIDRLGRNYSEILAEWRRLTQDKRVAIVVMDMPLLDTRVASTDVTGAFLADMMLQLLSYVAQVERDNTRQRQAEGIAAAQARGVRFGRPSIQLPENYERVRDSYRAGAITRKEAAEQLGVCVRTFDKWLKGGVPS